MLLGITGGIASGKSTVTKRLRELGCVVIDADLVNRELSSPGGPIWLKIRESFGEEFLCPDGRVNKKKLGSLVFGAPEKRTLLEKIAHPLIIEEENRRIEEIRTKSPAAIIVLEAALMIEAGEHHRVDKLIVVDADEERRAAWLTREKKLDPEEAWKRIKAQTPVHEKMKFADHVIRNNGSREDLRKEVDRLFEEIMAAKDF